MNRRRFLAAFGAWAVTARAGAFQRSTSGNPILSGWYADPEAHVFNGQYWIFPTYSAPYGEQTFLDAFSSKDLITWADIPLQRIQQANSMNVLMTQFSGS